MDLFGDAAAILNSIVSNSYYGMLRVQISMHMPPEHETREFKMAAVSLKRSIVSPAHLHWATMASSTDIIYAHENDNNYSLTESEVFTGKSRTDTLPY